MIPPVDLDLIGVFSVATAPVDIPVQVKGLSDLQKLERRMEALEKEVTRLYRKTAKAQPTMFVGLVVRLKALLVELRH